MAEAFGDQSLNKSSRSGRRSTMTLARSCRLACPSSSERFEDCFKRLGAPDRRHGNVPLGRKMSLNDMNAPCISGTRGVCGE
jgi:hypothetical protein